MIMRLEQVIMILLLQTLLMLLLVVVMAMILLALPKLDQMDLFNPDFGKFYGGAGSDTFYMGLTSYGHIVSLPDFNPAEDNIILSPSNVGRGLTGYDINGNELTLTYHNTSYPGNESKIILPDGLDVTAVQNAITIDDPLPDWMETYPTITHNG